VKKRKKRSLAGTVVNVLSSTFTLIGSILNLAIIGFLIYVIFHFVTKYYHVIYRYW
jgi:hypothetical protein